MPLTSPAPPPPPSPPPSPPTTEPSSPPEYVYVPEGRLEIWLHAHVAWLQDPTTSFNFWHRVYCAFAFALLTAVTTPFLWILPSCFLPNWAKALWVAFLSWEWRKQWRFWKKRAAAFRKREEEESDELESGLGEGVMVDVKSGVMGGGDEKKGREEV